MSPNAGIRKRIEGKSYSDPEAKKDFDKFMDSKIKAILPEKGTFDDVVKSLQKPDPIALDTKPEEVKTEDVKPEEVKTETDELGAPRDTSDDVQLIKVEEGKIVPDTSDKTEVAGQRIEPKLEIKPIDPTITPTDTDPKFDTEVKQMSLKEMDAFITEQKLFGKTDKEISDAVRQNAINIERANLKKEGLSDQEIDETLRKAGVLKDEKEVKVADDKPKLEIADDKKLEIVDDTPKLEIADAKSLKLQTIRNLKL